MRAFAASKNAGKLREMRAIFDGSVLEVEEYPEYADVVEDAETYEGNALLKARSLAAQLREAGESAAVLADDSGLEVEALGGRPGIYSARYAAGASWPQRRAVLLREVDGAAGAERAARFVCAMALVLAKDREIVVRATVDGVLADAERGDGGFGYDPIFFYPPCGCTFAELSEAEKNSVSHRRRAADALLAALSTRV